MQAGPTSDRPGTGLTREIQSKIGQQLRAVYDDVVEEGVPDRFTDLLRRLEQGDQSLKPSEGGAGGPGATLNNLDEGSH